VGIWKRAAEESANVAYSMRGTDQKCVQNLYWRPEGKKTEIHWGDYVNDKEYGDWLWTIFICLEWRGMCIIMAEFGLCVNGGFSCVV
jgi:hypothetical protein